MKIAFFDWIRSKVADAILAGCEDAVAALDSEHGEQAVRLELRLSTPTRPDRLTSIGYDVPPPPVELPAETPHTNGTAKRRAGAKR